MYAGTGGGVSTPIIKLACSIMGEEHHKYANFVHIFSYSLNGLLNLIKYKMKKMKNNIKK